MHYENNECCVIALEWKKKTNIYIFDRVRVSQSFLELVMMSSLVSQTLINVKFFLIGEGSH